MVLSHDVVLYAGFAQGDPELASCYTPGMSIDVATWVSEFPEFQVAAASQPAMFERALRAATRLVDPALFGTAYQDAVFLLASHFAALSPFGENLRLKDGTTAYEQQYKQLRDSRRPRVMVGGGLLGGSRGY